MDTHNVKVYIYDLSQGMARAMSQAFLGRQIEGIWHTGIVVYGQEFFYGGSGGIEYCQPGGTMLGQPTRIHDLGQTQIPYDMFHDYLKDLAQSTFGPNTYHLLDHNCNTFSSEVAQFLTGNDIPGEITGLPAEVMSTPFGQMIRPFIDAMSIQPSGGHAIFPQNSAPSPARTEILGNPSSKTSTPSNQTPSNQTPSNPAQNTTSPSTVPSNPSEEKLCPFVHKVDIPDVCYWKSTEINISPEEQNHITEVYEFLSQRDVTWSLGRDHLSTLQRLALNSDTSTAKSALQIMTKLALSEDILQLWSHDPKSKFPEILDKFDGLTDDIKVDVIKMLTNCCSLECGHRLLTEKHQQSVADICSSCLLSKHTNLTESAISFCYNLTLRKISDDTTLTLGSAILNCTGQDFNEQTVFHLLGATLQLMKASDEVNGLAGVLGVDFNRFRGNTTRVDLLCDRISKLL